MKLMNETGKPWGSGKQKNTKITHLDFIDIQDRSLFVGVSIGPDQRDCVVLMYKDRTYWELKTNVNEDGFEFLYRNIKKFTKNRYMNALNTFLKEYLVITMDACLSSPVKPEYYTRDVELERNHCSQNNQRGKLEDYLKITDWINHFPISGTSKRVYIETSPLSNFPFDVKEIREINKEKEFLIEAYKIINGLKDPVRNVKGWNEENFKDEYFRDAFGSMLVSIAYARWKSNDKSGKDDFLKIVVDHDGVFWLLDHTSLDKKIVREEPRSNE